MASLHLLVLAVCTLLLQGTTATVMEWVRTMLGCLLFLVIFLEAQASSPLAEQDIEFAREDDPDEDLYVINKHGVPHVVEPASLMDGADEGEGNMQALLEAVYDEDRRLQDLEEGGPPLDPEENPIPLVDLAKIIYPKDSGAVLGSDVGVSMSRRMITSSQNRRWQKAIVPYRYMPEVTTKDQKEIEAAMLRFERYTCMRFVPWEMNKTRHEYGLKYDGHLRFIKGGGCYAVLGYSRSSNGQSISCCGRTICTHELGHAFGMHHEHQNPLRDGWIRINYDEMKTSSISSYRENSLQISYGYDYSSRMHYRQYSWNHYTFLFPELRSHNNIFYFFKEVSMEHDCIGLTCPDTTLQCFNDGYSAVVEGQCRCLCPPGLTPQSGCLDVDRSGPNSMEWPAGRFAMFKPETTGCPEGSQTFDTGSYEHFSESVGPVAQFLAGEFTSRRLKYEFCVAKADRSSNSKWGTGRYCIFRKGGTCPDKFHEGSIQYDDDKPGTESGTIPDGVFNNDTRLYFCCRDDGFTEEPLVLPNSKPFVLFRTYKACQKVEGMQAYPSEVAFNNKNTDLVAMEGVLPYKSYSSTYKILRLRYCYYVPSKRDCGSVIELSRGSRTATFTSPSYPSPYPQHLHCHWLVKAPEGATILLSFDDFDVEGTTTSCKDKVNVRYFRIGQPGITYCGEGVDGSIRSLNNTMMVQFTSDYKGNNRGFQARVELVLPEDACYNLEDKGRSYNGRVNFTRNFAPCLNWRDVAHCRHSQFQPRDADTELAENYCRNPGDGLMPWCYTKAEGCVRDYCDVCLLQKPVDRKENCAELQGQGVCQDQGQASAHCAKTCQQEVMEPLRQEVVPVQGVTCPPPPTMEDADIVTAPEVNSVGSVVTYRCKTANVDLNRTCLTSGQWSGGGYVCGGCPTGWVPYGRACYHYPGSSLSLQDANVACSKYGANVASASNMDDLDFLGNMTLNYKDMWIGITDAATEGEWRTMDDSLVSWTNWAVDEPTNGRSEDCAFVRMRTETKEWADVNCGYRRFFICKLVPGGCPAGWQQYEGACYLFENIRKNYLGARRHCAKHGALMAGPKNEQEMAFMLELLDKKGDMFVGISDRETEGQWILEDGSPVTYTNWKPGEPNNRRGRQDVAVVKVKDAKKRWIDVVEKKPFRFICKKNSDARTVCADRRGDCQQLVEQTPDLCQQQEDFAWFACPSTCQVC